MALNSKVSLETLGNTCDNDRTWLGKDDANKKQASVEIPVPANGPRSASNLHLREGVGIRV